MGLVQNLQQETIAHLPLREPILVSPDSDVASVVATMREKKLGCAIVVDSSNMPVGLFSERSIIEILLQGVEMDLARVAEFLDPNWRTVRLSDPIRDVFEAIQDERLRFICVTDDDGRVAGLTGQRGLAEYIAEHYPHQVMVQRVGGKLSFATREGG